MGNFNNVVISGNLVSDCEKKQAGQTPLASFVVAVNDSKKDANGEWVDYPNFIECNLFGQRAKNMSDSLVKGQKVFITGKLYQSRWQKDGINMSKISITVDKIELERRNTQIKPDSGTQEAIPW